MNVASAGCPAPERLRSFVALELAGPDESYLRRHLAHCPACTGAVQALELSFLFALRPARTLAPEAWTGVEQALREAILASPRQPSRTAFAERLFAGFRRAAAPALAATLLVVLGFGFFAPGAPSPAVKPVAVAADASTMATSFVYLSNPEARVTHLLVGGGHDRAPVQLTLVVDEGLEELFEP